MNLACLWDLPGSCYSCTVYTPPFPPLPHHLPTLPPHTPPHLFRCYLGQLWTFSRTFLPPGFYLPSLGLLYSSRYVLDCLGPTLLMFDSFHLTHTAPTGNTSGHRRFTTYITNCGKLPIPMYWIVTPRWHSQWTLLGPCMPLWTWDIAAPSHGTWLSYPHTCLFLLPTPSQCEGIVHAFGCIYTHTKPACHCAIRPHLPHPPPSYPTPSACRQCPNTALVCKRTTFFGAPTDSC